ncbi:MAG TPA: mechanosensitive ion channel family protein [Thermodesulfobacteriota bacterium]|nr:mechanosensitive ion channel family protein [Thermodesulfobacteriota bacterium]
MTEILDMIFNPDYLENLIAWLRTSGVRIIVIVIGAYLLLKIINLLIVRAETWMARETGDLFVIQETEKRVRTLGGILRKVALVAIFIIAFMMILREFGMDIAPIIAGAGIVGLAIGFGAQNLVRDIISGFFIIMENQVRVGDVAVVNGTGGLVEQINLRTIVLRDLQGTVHVFPNGTINTLSNMSKGWSRYVVDVGVAYKENVDEVMQVLRDIGEGLSKDEKFGPMIMEPLQVLGVDNFGSSEVVIKCMVKTLPLKQWDVGRELRRRIKNTFDQKGIEIPFPHVSVYFGEASKPFALDVNKTGNGKSIFNNEGYELIKRIAANKGVSVEEFLNEVAEKLGESGRSS